MTQLTLKGLAKEAKKGKTKKVRNIPFYILALICATSLFSYEFFPDETEAHKLATQEWRKSRKERGKTLSKVKTLAIGTPEYEAYKKAADKTNKSYEGLKKVREEDKFFGFTNMQQFFGEFGPMLCFFIYALFNLFRSFYFESKNIGSKVLHIFIINGTLYYFYWMFQPFPNFNKATYYLLTFFSAGIILLTVYLITKYEQSYINVLKKSVREMVSFSLFNTKEEKKDELFDLVEKITKDKKEVMNHN